MKPTHLLASLLTITALLWDMAAASRLETTSQAAFVVYLGAACGQLALVAIWCVWGNAAWRIRILAVLGAAAFLSGPLARITVGRWWEWIVVLCLFAVMVAAPLGFARWHGLRAGLANAAEPDAMPGRPLRRGQFSLGGLLSLMTVVAIGCGLREHVAFPWPHAQALASYGTCLTWVAVGSVWAMVSCRATGLRVTVLTLLCMAAGIVMSRTELARDIGFFTMVALGESVVICVGLNICLTSGLHMSWTRDTP